MSKKVTLRFDEPVYELLRSVAERENRALSNFIKTAVIKFLEEHQAVDEFEMAEINGNARLQESLKRGTRDARQRKGAFV